MAVYAPRMPITPGTRAVLQIHLCVALWGFTAILGKLISLPALPLVWWRMLMVTLALLLLPRVWRGLAAIRPRQRWAYAGNGCLVALHWLTFYGAIKLSNASVAATCVALATVITALIEPAIARRPFAKRELVLGLSILPGVAAVVGGVPEAMREGVAVGGVSALFVALFGSLNKRWVEHGDPFAVTALELGAGVLLLTLLAPAMPIFFPAFAGEIFALPGPRDAVLLLILAVVCTLIPFTLSLVALRHMSAFSAQLAINLEPVYAIALAILLFDEQRELGRDFYLGVLILLGAVLLHPLLSAGSRAAVPREAATRGRYTGESDVRVGAEDA